MASFEFSGTAANGAPITSSCTVNYGFLPQRVDYLTAELTRTSGLLLHQEREMRTYENTLNLALLALRVVFHVLKITAVTVSKKKGESLTLSNQVDIGARLATIFSDSLATSMEFKPDCSIPHVASTYGTHIDELKVCAPSTGPSDIMRRHHANLLDYQLKTDLGCLVDSANKKISEPSLHLIDSLTRVLHSQNTRLI